MKRIPEPELMNDREQAEAYANADFSEPHNAFVKEFSNRFYEFTKGEVLDLGCGTADVIIRFALAYPGSAITGIDGSQAMLDLGLESVIRNRLTKQIKLRKCLLPNPELSEKTYDAIISNSLLHHLKKNSVLWNTVKYCSRKGTLLFIMDLMRPDSVGLAKKIVQAYAGEEQQILQKDFFNSLRAAYTVEEIEDQLKAESLSHLKVESVSDRHLIIWGRR
jgi:ubiquinone/menaquinone biosynthesis C-methylase UbiE